MNEKKDRIFKFLSKNEVNQVKSDSIRRVVKKYKIDVNQAEKIYDEWRKHYMQQME